MAEVTKTFEVHFPTGQRGRKRIKRGPTPVVDTPSGRVPRLSRLMALAYHFENLIEQGGVYSQTDLAQLGHVSRARVTQIMNMLHLAPDIQAEILFLPPITQGREPIPETKIRPIIREVCWERQREMWRNLHQSINIKAF